jgi:hypothetical protein
MPGEGYSDKAALEIISFDREVYSNMITIRESKAVFGNKWVSMRSVYFVAASMGAMDIME